MTKTKIRFSAPTKCGHCSNVAPMSIVAVFDDTGRVEQESGEISQEGIIYNLLKCPACKGVTLRSYYWHECFESEGDIVYKQLYPNDPRIPSGLPSSIEKAFLASIKVKSIDPNAFGVLIGRVIELVCADRAAEGHTLNEQLKNLASKGEIPSKLVEVADKLRGFRNVGAHAVLGELTIAEIPIVEDLCRALLDYIYTAPHLAESAKAKLGELSSRRRRKS